MFCFSNLERSSSAVIPSALNGLVTVDDRRTLFMSKFIGEPVKQAARCELRHATFSGYRSIFGVFIALGPILLSDSPCLI